MTTEKDFSDPSMHYQINNKVYWLNWGKYMNRHTGHIPNYNSFRTDEFYKELNLIEWLE